MKFKLDENIATSGAELLRAAGHDVETVKDEGLSGSDDERVFTTAVSEERALITLDWDFAQVLRFPPDQSAGIAVLDLGARASLTSLHQRLRGLLSALETTRLAGSLWIVEPGRVRVHLPDDGGEDPS